MSRCRFSHDSVVSRGNYDTRRLPGLAHFVGAKSILLLPIDDPSGETAARPPAGLHATHRAGAGGAGAALGLMRSPLEAYP